jgi:hypothetical protein
MIVTGCGKNEEQTRQIGSTDQTAMTEETSATAAEPQASETDADGHELTISSEPTSSTQPTSSEGQQSLVIGDNNNNQQLPTATPAPTQPSGTNPSGTQPSGTPTDGTPAETTDGPVVVDVAWQYATRTYVVDKTHWCIHKPNCSHFDPEDNLQTVDASLRNLVDLNQLNVCQECLGEGCTYDEEPWIYETAYWVVDMDTHRIHRANCENINLDNYTRTVYSTLHVLETRNYLFRCPDCFADPEPEDEGNGG